MLSSAGNLNGLRRRKIGKGKTENWGRSYFSLPVIAALTHHSREACACPCQRRDKLRKVAGIQIRKNRTVPINDKKEAIMILDFKNKVALGHQCRFLL